MKKLLLIVLALCFPAFCNAQTRPQDVTGWTSIKWGMTVDEAKAVLGDSAEVLPPKPNEQVTRLVIHHVKIGSGEGVATLSGPRNSQKITQVVIDATDGLPNGLRSLRYSELKTLLIQKYGPPTNETNSPQRGEMEASVLWVFPSTTIELIWSDDFKSFGFIGLGYSATKNDRSGNL